MRQLERSVVLVQRRKGWQRCWGDVEGCQILPLCAPRGDVTAMSFGVRYSTRWPVSCARP